MTQKKALLLNDPPLKDIKDLVRRQIPVIALKVRRRAANNREMIIWSFRKDYPVSSLTDGQLEKELQEHSGGGQYIVQMFDNENSMEPLSPRWLVNLEGQPFDPHSRPQYAPQRGLGGMPMASVPFAPTMPSVMPIGGVNVPAAAMHAGMPMPPVNTAGEILGPPPASLMSSGEMRNFDFKTQWQHVYDNAAATGQLDPAHQVSVDFANKFDDRRESTLAENARLHEKLAHEKETHVERMAAMAMQASSGGGGLASVMPVFLQMMQQQAQQQAQQSQQNMQMMLALLTREPQRTGPDANTLLGLAAALVPVATAFITHGSDRHNQALQAQMKQQELQMQQQQAFQQLFLQSTTQKMDLPGLLAAGAPIATALLTARQSRDELALQRQDAHAQNSMVQLKMMSDMLAERAREQGSPDIAEMIMRFTADMMPELPKVIDALRGGGKAPVQRLAAPQQQQAPQQPQQAMPTQAPADALLRIAQGLHVAPDVDPQTSLASWVGLLELDDDAAQATSWVMSQQLSKVGADFTTIAWREAVFHAHHLSDPEVTAARFRAVIDAAYDANLFPQIVRTALEQDTRGVLEQLMKNMPVGEAHPEYMHKVLDVFMAQLQRDQEAGAVERAQQAAQAAGGAPVQVAPAAPAAAVEASDGGTDGGPSEDGADADDDDDDDADDESDDVDDDDDMGDDEPLGPEALIRGPTFDLQGSAS